ncbi:MAG TPA: bifunctional methionine sulfoxide reductase B/A protein [Phycisphaerales bacterium]|nr:bifunctional methionine sulfoxide reductase B/A protein [Phycisphaerales bacterium]
MKSGVALLLAVVLGITGVGLLRQGVGGCPGGVCGASMLLSAAGLGDPAMSKPDAQEKSVIKTNAMKVKYSKSGYDVTPLGKPQVEELSKKLTPAEAEVILAKGTERAFCGNLVDNHEEGVYLCRLCGLPLFSSDAKFDSGTGWPSFFQPIDPDHLRQIEDRSYGMVRTEILCARCGAHLGHVFDDGPKPTGQRHCLNSVSLTFVNKKDLANLPGESRPVKTETAYFAGGCFWGVEDRFQQVPGVVDAISGYMGGKTKSPTYKQVCYENTGHAETVKVVFDPARVTYRQLLEAFFRFHDPTTLNRQGPDVGDQYRSAIFAASAEQLQQARAFIEEMQKSPKFGDKKKIVTQVVGPEQSGPFTQAEDYHQDYHLKHGGSCALPPE